MMKKHIFRAGTLAAAVAGLTLLASCGSGLLDTKDEAWETNVLTVEANSISANYGMAGDPVEVTITLKNGTFSDELTSAIEGATTDDTVDITDYFDIKFVDSDGSQYALLRSYSLAAESTVVDAEITAGSTANTSCQYSITALLSYKLSTNYTEASSGTVQISANTNALSAAISVRSATTFAYSFDTGSYSLLAPTASTIKSALATIAADTTTFSGLNACARVSLPVPTSKEVAAGDLIATATIGSATGVKVYAAADCVEEVGVLPVIFASSESTYTGAVTLTFDSTVANIGESEEIDSESAVATNLYVPYYGEDFESVTSLNDVMTITGDGSGLVTGDGTYGTYAKLAPSSSESGNRGSYTGTTTSGVFSLTDATETNTSVTYGFEFDSAMTPGSAYTTTDGRSASGVALAHAPYTNNYDAIIASDSSVLDEGTATGYHNSVCVGIGSIPADAKSNNTRFYYQKADGTMAYVTMPSGVWCHYAIKITSTYAESGNSYAATMVITNSTTGDTILSETVACSALPKLLWTCAARGSTAGNTLDNIIAYTPCGE